MSLPRFYMNLLRPGIAVLDEAESRHAHGSRRLSPGDQVILFNGRGDEGSGAIIQGKKRSIEVEVARVDHHPRRSPQLTLAVAPPKGPRQDWLIEKCTELGVAAIQPILTQRSVSDVSDHRLSKWRKTAIEAAKQSGQAWLPEMRELMPLKELWTSFTTYQAVYIASASGDSQVMSVTWPERVLVLIGPEGDWTPEELDATRSAGARAISLGPNVLRVETAAVAVAALVHAAMI